MTASRLMYVISDGSAADDDGHLSERRLLDHVVSAAAAGATHYQIRERKLSARRLFDLVSAVVSAVKGSTLTVLVNDRVDIAVAAGADGVHLTSRSFSAKAVRETFGNDILVAVSTHHADEIVRAKAEGADMAVFGPVFETPGKKAVGIERLQEACRAAAGFPVLALGGVDVCNAGEAIAAGAAGIAAIRSLSDAEKIARMAEVLKHG